MKIAGALLGSVLLAGCGGAPDPVRLIDIEAADRRFAAPRPSDSPSPAEALLGKKELTLQDVLSIADAMNPELERARQEVGLAGAAIWEASLHPNPSLLLQAEDYRTKDGTTIGRMERTVGLSVPLALGGRIGAAVSAAEKEREIATVTYVWRRREILGGVKRAFVGLLASRRAAQLARETRDLARSLRAAAEDRFNAQAVPEMELLKAAVTLARAEVDLTLAEKNAAVSLPRLRALMGNVDLPQDRFAGELPARFAAPSLEALRGQVAAGHPLLEAATMAKEAAELRLDLARTQRIPDVALDVTVGKGPDDDTIVEGGLSIPLPLFNRNQGAVAAAEINVRQADLRIQAVRNDLMLRLIEAYRSFTAAQDRVAAYQEEILPKAEKALAQTIEGYRLGKFGSLDVLDAQRTSADARTSFVAALAELNIAVSELEELTGMGLEALR